mmetsp:Transcript_25724/g.60312  ORF Transcript_25724/g.60312 Transcript_25724/m.60312 type:complete len:312 (+) Transcript_25724:149-1084(+)
MPVRGARSLSCVRDNDEDAVGNATGDGGRRSFRIFRRIPLVVVDDAAAGVQRRGGKGRDREGPDRDLEFPPGRDPRDAPERAIPPEFPVRERLRPRARRGGESHQERRKNRRHADGLRRGGRRHRSAGRRPGRPGERGRPGLHDREPRPAEPDQPGPGDGRHRGPPPQGGAILRRLDLRQDPLLRRGRDRPGLRVGDPLRRGHPGCRDERLRRHRRVVGSIRPGQGRHAGAEKGHRDRRGKPVAARAREGGRRRGPQGGADPAARSRPAHPAGNVQLRVRDLERTVRGFRGGDLPGIPQAVLPGQLPRVLR